MDSVEFSDVLRQIGWHPGELARRLGVRPGSVYDWLGGRRSVPDNLAAWLIAVRDGLASAGPLPEGWDAAASRRGRLV